MSSVTALEDFLLAKFGYDYYIFDKIVLDFDLVGLKADWIVFKELFSAKWTADFVKLEL